METGGSRMNKNAHFGNLTPRMQQFREELLECRPYICAERAVLATQSYKEHADKPITLKREMCIRDS